MYVSDVYDGELHLPELLGSATRDRDANGPPVPEKADAATDQTAAAVSPRRRLRHNSCKSRLFCVYSGGSGTATAAAVEAQAVLRDRRLQCWRLRQLCF
jgi:hypothetical protein